MPISSNSPPTLLMRGDVADFLGIELKKLTWWVWALDEQKRYRSFEIAKRNGGTRTIAAPIRPIKDIQRRLAEHLTQWYSPPTHAHGYVSGRDPSSNAGPHRRQEWVLRVDLSDFFPSIHFGRVRGLFMAPPLSFGPDAATLLAQICCHDHKLPQGAPTSPVISNMICRGLDRELAKIASRERCFFTRYADDLTFSTDRTRFPSSLAYLEGATAYVGSSLERLITDAGFSINADKTRLARRSQRQRVTGLVVNRQLNIPRTYVRELRTILYVWERYGRPAAEASLEAARRDVNRPEGVSPLSFPEAIRGKIQYVGSIKGWHDPVYVGLADRLALLDADFGAIRRRSEPKPRLGRAGSPQQRELYVCTEGASDIVHLASAMRYFHERGEYLDLELRFDSESNAGNDKALARRLRELPAIRPSMPTVCVFDRDNMELLRSEKLLQQAYKDCGNGVFGAALALPPFRDDPICIELLFKDAELLVENDDSRRIFRLSEFDTKTAQHTSKRFNLSEPKSKTLIRDDVFELATGRSAALSKTEFAARVEARDLPFAFDFDGFRPTIELLKEAVEEVSWKVKPAR